MAATSQYPEPPSIGDGRRGRPAIAAVEPLTSIDAVKMAGEEYPFRVPQISADPNSLSGVAQDEPTPQANEEIGNEDWETRSDHLERARLAGTTNRTNVDVQSPENSVSKLQTQTDSQVAVQISGTALDRTQTQTQASAQTAPSRRDGSLTGRGAFFLITGITGLTCVIGFFTAGATFIPAATGWGLVAGSLLAALLVRRADKAVAFWSPPVAMATVVALLGQITLLGASATIARETTMFLAAMASSAPLQLLAVVGAFIILRIRFRKPKRSSTPEQEPKESSGQETPTAVDLTD